MIGALTNISRLLTTTPEIRHSIKELIVMGGTYKGEGNAPNWCSEYNFYSDPEAAR